MKKLIALFGILLLLPIAFADTLPIADTLTDAIVPDRDAIAPNRNDDISIAPVPDIAPASESRQSGTGNSKRDCKRSKRGFILNKGFEYVLKEFNAGRSVPYIPGMFKWACFTSKYG